MAVAPIVRLETHRVSHRIAGSGFTISRGKKTHAHVVMVCITITMGEQPSSPFPPQSSPSSSSSLSWSPSPSGGEDTLVVRGRGECVPYARYGESVESVIGTIESDIEHKLISAVTADVSASAAPVVENRWTQREACASRLAAFRERMLHEIAAGAARNAVDCALWDCECKLLGRRIWEMDEVNHLLFGGARGASSSPAALQLDSCVTVSIDTEKRMREGSAARVAAGAKLLKVKVGAPGEAGTDEDMDIARVRAVREAAGEHARLIIDANEGWGPCGRQLERLTDAMHRLDVSLLEQPLPADDDDFLLGFRSPVPLCADESMHTSDSLGLGADGDEACARLLEKYQVLNLKLDKTGGLTEALRTYARIRELNERSLARPFGSGRIGVMTGCMVCSSLGIAPMLATVARVADFVDLDGGALLAQDVPNAIEYSNGGGRASVAFSAELWG